MGAARLIIVSNRLPVSVDARAGGARLRPSTGGLATGLGKLHQRGDSVWIGWPGDLSHLDADGRRRLDRELEGMRIVPVHLAPREVDRYYEGFANGVLWPTFHYLLESVPLASDDWGEYRSVNARFAEAVVATCRDDDLIWVHDYQLMLVPAMVRRRRPRARIGFFLHIPFPSSEVFRTLPMRAEILDGLVGADLVGFHTAAHMRHFASALLRVLGEAVEIDRVWIGNRLVRLGVFPMGVDAAGHAALGDDAQIVAEADLFRGERDALHLVGIDRLDYTKGLPRRLLAFERLLIDHPELRERVRMIQVAVPSRERVEAYARFRRHVERLVGRINGAFATPRWVPVHYMLRTLSAREVASLYRLAAVMVVTPVRDGMNLVAKEFVATRTDEDGVLVLSELAGAASELAEALQVNPYDVAGTAAALHRALTMEAEERRVRMQGLRRRVLAYDVHAWVASFIAALTEATAAAPGVALAPSAAVVVERLLATARRAARLVLLLDYDGTLVPFEQSPELAAPDAALGELLARLASRPGTEVHIVSGRRRAALERWFGAAGVGLHAEHGLWSRSRRGDWTRVETPPTPWRGQVRQILNQFAARTPGSLVEEKEVSLAWHFRAADAEFGQRQANELRLHLTELLSNVPVEILSGSKVVEVRPYGVNKGQVVRQVAAKLPPDDLLIAFGDDHTDEDMFAALPDGALAVHVGPQRSQAQLRLLGPADVRALLTRLCAAADRSDAAGNSV